MIEPWSQDGTLARRRYQSYGHYRVHQAAKIETMEPDVLSTHHERFRDALEQRLRSIKVRWRSRRVLCLGARSGAEVHAFLRRGAFAVGVDLNPGRGNKYVLTGDFHKLAFAKASVDVVYTNAFDHVYDEVAVLSEIHRVLGRGGLLIIEAMLGTKDGGRPGDYESLSWSTVDGLVEIVEAGGFELGHFYEIDDPWSGEHLEFVRVE